MLFLIYIRDLFTDLQEVYPLSYIDDIGLSAATTSLTKNIRILERATRLLYDTGNKNAIQFDLAKTELIHFTKGKGSEKGVWLLDSQKVLPTRKVRWLGIWFDPLLSFKAHTETRASQARQAFYRMERLANLENGLLLSALRQYIEPV
jgi:hypothetical protein